MILFWDKNTGRRIPQALQRLRPREIEVKYYLELFPMSGNVLEGGDDRWLRLVGEQGWIAISQDYRIHTKQNELFAIKQFNVGCFYLWGASEPQWEVMRCFARAYDRIIQASAETPRPFIYRVTQSGLLRKQDIP